MVAPGGQLNRRRLWGAGHVSLRASSPSYQQQEKPVLGWETASESNSSRWSRSGELFLASLEMGNFRGTVCALYYVFQCAVAGFAI